MTVIPIDAEVRVGSDIPGTVTAVAIRAGGYVLYEVEYWDGRTRYSGWFAEGQVKAVYPDARTPIGFSGGRTSDHELNFFTDDGRILNIPQRVSIGGDREAPKK